MAARTSADEYVIPGIDPDFTPFLDADFDRLAAEVAPLQVTRARFAVLALQMNSAASIWALQRALEVAPTEIQEGVYVQAVQRAAAKLTNLLNVRFEVDADGAPDVPSSTASHPQMPYDPTYVEAARARGGKLPEDFPPDPSSAGAWSLPTALERVLPHFERHNHDDTTEPSTPRPAEEALLDLRHLARSLADGASDRLNELRDRTPDRRKISARQSCDGNLSADVIVTLDEGKSANHALFLDLVPIYEELFDTALGSSRKSPSGTGLGNRPSGPALRFFKFVYDRLDAPAKGRKDETILDWVKDWKAGREAKA